jgi:hypothetical protein
MRAPRGTGGGAPAYDRFCARGSKRSISFQRSAPVPTTQQAHVQALLVADWFDAQSAI